MSEKRGGRTQLLKSMLVALTDEWGFESVRKELDRLQMDGLSRDSVGMRDKDEVKTVERKDRAKDKPTAGMLAANVSLPPVQKQLIQTLAERFDRKRFLPTSGDIKDFFEVHGEPVPSAKQRSESFRRILRLLSSLPESSLRRMIENDFHSGPSSLAPLSEAMRALGAQRYFPGGEEVLDIKPDPGTGEPDS